MYYQSSGPISTAGATTTLALPSLKQQPGNTLFPAKSVTLVIANPANSGQTINAASLVFTQLVGGVPSTITYALTSPSIAAGANQTFLVPLTSGIFANPTLSVTFAGTPSAGTLATEAAWNENI